MTEYGSDPEEGGGGREDVAEVLEKHRQEEVIDGAVIRYRRQQMQDQ